MLPSLRALTPCNRAPPSLPRHPQTIVVQAAFELILPAASLDEHDEGLQIKLTRAIPADPVDSTPFQPVQYASPMGLYHTSLAFATVRHGQNAGVTLASTPGVVPRPDRMALLA